MYVRQGFGRRVHMVSVVSVVIGLIVAVSGVAGSASAAPGDPPPAMSLRDLGASTTVTFPGQQGEVSLSLPVAPDLTPSVLRADTQVPAFVTGGSIDVLQGERLISRTPLPTGVNASIELPLRGVRVDQNAVNLTLRAYLRVDGFCQFDPDNALRMTNTSVVYTGREAIPQTVAEFLPPTLRGLTIYVPDDVGEAEGAAAVNLATAVVSQYAPAPVPIETVALPRGSMVPPTVAGPLERQIVVNGDADPGLTIETSRGSSYLVIGGSDEDLLTQTQFLTSNLAPIALSSSAVAGALHNAPQLPQSVQTLSNLGVPDQSITSAAWPRLTFGIDQTRLGWSATGVRVQLIGSYSPGPSGSSSSDGAIAVRVGDRVITTIPTDDSGTFNTWVDIPDDVLRRYTEVSLTLERGNLGETCGSGYRNTLSLSSAGEITSEQADPPQPAGFGSLPQALMPRTQLAWTTGDSADVARAVSIVTGLQALSAVPLGIDVVSMDTASTSGQPAILISADGAGLPDLTLPLQADGRTLTVTSTGSSAQASTVTLTPGIEFGALEVTRQDGRTLVVATSTDDARDLDALLDWLTADNARWASLDGDAIVQVSGQEPVALSADEVNQGAEEPDRIGSWIIAVALLGALVLAGAVIFGTIVIRRRRGRPESS
ncbi:hypothetical protein GIY30_01165 [Gordonia sp. HNM0687]|uniref:Cellulose biosynthesis cyclic di-GMP-binding regulatory protein BcsB n=1 Tax=Gordonia mangrovi TaxID=2665643 RepID=A0A6L7GJC5_9ACTN|nr:hypothetical protein [Gordonia mangrovi]MXP19976.1 hypothetical protein [Gordonia mangrovi]UVF79407.1 hypothetical protein NWF22_06085 [Gordonia mangrovi]